MRLEVIYKCKTCGKLWANSAPITVTPTSLAVTSCECPTPEIGCLMDLHTRDERTPDA